MDRNYALAALCAVLSVSGLMAQTSSSTAAATPAHPASIYSRLAQLRKNTEVTPFSRLAVSGGISLAGINLQAAVNANRYLNIRGAGSIFKYTDNNISTNGFNASASINLASAGVSLDYFPWPNHGFRVSPGVQFYNQNGLSGTMVAAGGTSFSLNDYTYYSSQTNPVTGNASVDLHKNAANPSISIGWGNMIPRHGGHWSFPLEIGGVYTGQPKVNMVLTSGQVCSDPAGTQNCQNVVGDATINSNLQAQITKYQNDLNPLQFYPVVSFGVAYSFQVKGR